MSHFWKWRKWKDDASSSFEDSRDKKGGSESEKEKKDLHYSTSVAISAFRATPTSSRHKKGTTATARKSI